MSIFIDSSDLHHIQQSCEYGWVKGVTTNPLLLAQSGMAADTLLAAIKQMCPGPIFYQVMAENFQQMIEEASRSKTGYTRDDLTNPELDELYEYATKELKSLLQEKESGQQFYWHILQNLLLKEKSQLLSHIPMRMRAGHICMNALTLQTGMTFLLSILENLLNFTSRTHKNGHTIK